MIFELYTDEQFIKDKQRPYTYDEFVGVKYVDWSNIMQIINYWS